jgi:hypothetical protein
MKLASAGNKAGIEAMINKYFFSTNYIVTADNRIHNPVTGKFMDSFSVSVKKSRWIFENKI